MALWTPSKIDTALWLDAADADTITLNSGNVSQWDDKSGNARHYTQGTSAQQPAYLTAEVNGLNVLDFNGSSHNLERITTDKGLPVSTEMTVFEVFRRASVGILSNLLGGANASGTPYSLQWWTDNVRYSGLRNLNAGFGTHGTADTATGHFISSLKRDATNVTLWSNGTQVGTPQAAQSASASPNLLYVGRRATNYHNGQILEIIAVASALSDADRQKIEGYLAWKWGLEANLPADHPYKAAAPAAAPAAEPFQLRHNPRTNKVIPVLSAPTVTDIGANCVRPRVTKGY